MKTPLNAERQAAFDKFEKESGQAAALVAFFGELGSEFLATMLDEPWRVLDVYETAPDGSTCERAAYNALKSRSFGGDGIAELWAHADTAKGFALVGELSLSSGFSLASNAIDAGVRKLGRFLTTLAGSGPVGDQALEKLVFNAANVADLVEVLKLTVQVPLSTSHRIVQQKLRQHSWDELFSGIKMLVSTNYAQEAMDELVLAAADASTTKQQAYALVAMTEPKSAARRTVLAKADSLPNAQPAA